MCGMKSNEMSNVHCKIEKKFAIMYVKLMAV